MSLLPVALFGAALAAALPTADPPLSCPAFKARLDAMVASMGSQVAPPGPMALAYDTEAGTRYDWTGPTDLTGSMTCGRSGTFEDFAIALSAAARVSDELPAALRRLSELAAASVCTLAEAEPAACRSLVRRMRDESLAQFKAALAKGDAVPVGSRDYFVVPGVDAEIALTPVAVTWSIGPGQAATTGTTRRTLDPKNVDE